MEKACPEESSLSVRASMKFYKYCSPNRTFFFHRQFQRSTTLNFFFVHICGGWDVSGSWTKTVTKVQELFTYITINFRLDQKPDPYIKDFGTHGRDLAYPPTEEQCRGHYFTPNVFLNYSCLVFPVKCFMFLVLVYAYSLHKLSSKLLMV